MRRKITAIAESSQWGECPVSDHSGLDAFRHLGIISYHGCSSSNDGIQSENINVVFHVSANNTLSSLWVNDAPPTYCDDHCKALVLVIVC